MRKTGNLLAIGSALAAIVVTLASPFAGAQVPREDSVHDAAGKARALVRQMTLDEKLGQMQDQAPAIPRLKIPSYAWGSEALHGVARAGYATVFPQAIGMAATWDSGLIQKEGQVISTEARAKYVAAQAAGIHAGFFGLTFWSPNLNIFRDPRWGRGQETLGEDPYLASVLAVEYVRGMQGNDPDFPKVIATPKHFDVHSGPEYGRHAFNAIVSPHDLEDTYLPAFRAAVVAGHAGSIMCSYNEINGVPSCTNSLLLHDILRTRWKFRGYVVSDCGAISDIDSGHHYAPDLERAAADALRAGTDLSCGTEYSILKEALHDGLVTEQEIDVAVERLLTARIRLGILDSPDGGPWAQISADDNDTPAHAALALRAAEESMVLLKNRNQTLPLSSSIRKIALIGPNAASVDALVGTYNGEPSHPITVLDGMRQQMASRGVAISYAQGSPYAAEDMLPVPPSAFHPRKGSPEMGLYADFFAGSDLAGRPVASTRVDDINVDWDASAPVPELKNSSKLFSVRYSGTIAVPAPGNYAFRVDVANVSCSPCEDVEMVRVYVDGKKVADLLEPGDNSDDFPQNHFSVQFNDTTPHQFVLEYSHSSPLFSAGLSLKWQPPIKALREQALKVAKNSDAIVAVVGLSPDLEGEEMQLAIPGFSHGDRTDIQLPPAQRDLLNALSATGKPLIVVLMNGSALAVNWAEEHADAMLEAWYPGESGGLAVARTLTGENNPAGRLPVTFYASLHQLPPFDDYSMRTRTYRYFNGKPLYPFGYGLSYATFAYRNLKLNRTSVSAGEQIKAQVDVQNTSSLAGDEVVEMYVQAPQRNGAPLRSLAGFMRISLQPGETRQVTLPVTARSMSVVDEHGTRRVESGHYVLSMGGGQPGDKSVPVASFNVVGTRTLPD